MALFEADRHEPLIDRAWDAAAAQDAVERIVDETLAAYQGPERLWPIHPLDRSPERPAVMKSLYYGAAGVIWALRRLGADQPEHRAAVPGLAAAGRVDDIRLDGAVRYGFGTGQAGFHWLDWSYSPSEDRARALHAAIEANRDHPAQGYLWGASGTALAALDMARRSGEARWADLYRAEVQALLAAWTYDPELEVHLWTQDLYGYVDHQLGALHGLAGDAFALLEGRDLLTPDGAAEIIARARRALHATALRADGLANWPMTAGESARPGAGTLRLQHCMGAPGMITAFAGLPSDRETDVLLTEAGELIWAAGPPIKFPCLCHGASGSGYAFLALHARTGDGWWLDRARAFAMHAIAQANHAREIHGQRKFSLWTGDLGLAVYLADCLAGAGRFPLFGAF